MSSPASQVVSSCKSAYAASFLVAADLGKRYAFETSDILADVLGESQPISLHRKAYILLGISKLIASNGEFLSKSARATWKAMNTLRELADEAQQLSLCRKSLRRKTDFTVTENPLMIFDPASEFPPYKLPKLAYTPSPSRSHVESIHSRDFPLDFTMDSAHTSLTDSMASHQSDIFGLVNNQILFDINEPSTRENQGTFTPVSSPVAMDSFGPQNESHEELPLPDSFDTEPEMADQTLDRQQRVQMRKIKAQRYIAFTSGEVLKWSRTYKEFCAATKRTKKKSIEEVFWGSPSTISRKRRRNRERRALRQRLLLEKVQQQEPTSATDLLGPPTPASDPVVPEHEQASDLDGMYDAPYDMDLGGLASPMLELRRNGNSNLLYDTDFLTDQSWNPLPDHPVDAIPVHLDREEMRSLRAKINEPLPTGEVSKENDKQVLCRITDLGGQCEFDDIHTPDRRDAGRAFFSVLRMATSGQLIVRQEAPFHEIKLQAAFRPH